MQDFLCIHNVIQHFKRMLIKENQGKLPILPTLPGQGCGIE